MVKESEVGSIPDSTDTPDLQDEGSKQLGIWHPDDGNQDDDNKEKQGTSIAKTEEWHETRRGVPTKRHWDEMPRIMRKKHYMKILLEQEGVWRTICNTK